MPELPEVEVTRQGIAASITGARITGVRVGKPLRWPLGIEPQALVGRTVRDVGRRGKYLLLRLDDGGVLLVHLGMSGSLGLHARPAPAGAHDHFDLATTGGTLRLHDPRRFGAVVWSPAESAAPAGRLLARLGMEPLDAAFHPERFHQALRQRRAAIKLVLMAGDVVVGAGNIYAAEALFAAGIHPATPAARLSRQRSDRLHAALRDVLGRAVALGGSTLRDFAGALGETGHFQNQTAVYGRAGLPCTRCGHTVRHIRQGQRATYYCPGCQH